MPNTKGVRRGTRYMFSRAFRKKGPLSTSIYLKVYKVGDFVDVKADGAIQRGMPHKFYHGRTGRVFNVTKRAVGVIVSKPIRQRIINKRINVRVEHVRQSRCREDFLRRVKENERLKKEAKEKGIKVSLKRQPKGPRGGHFVSTKYERPEEVHAIPYEFVA
ncbi:large ribosomal subunit protein eL21-like [Oscarella lobularis]|uniref:large ribosomal subunit protein eL21-like n=1 Tax=Oscarella lobularis TaxID=121494 RepID=UPI003313EC25